MSKNPNEGSNPFYLGDLKWKDPLALDEVDPVQDTHWAITLYMVDSRFTNLWIQYPEFVWFLLMEIFVSLFLMYMNKCLSYGIFYL